MGERCEPHRSAYGPLLLQIPLRQKAGCVSFRPVSNPTFATHDRFRGILLLCRRAQALDRLGAIVAERRRTACGADQASCGAAASCESLGMFLRHKIRRKDGKEHRYWSIVENRRVSGGRTVQRHVLYLGEINDASGLPGVGRSKRSTRTVRTVGRSRCSPRIVRHRRWIAMCVARQSGWWHPP